MKQTHVLSEELAANRFKGLVITGKTSIQHYKTDIHPRCQHLRDTSNSCFIMRHLSHHQLYFTQTKQNVTSLSKTPQNLLYRQYKTKAANV